MDSVHVSINEAALGPVSHKALEKALIAGHAEDFREIWVNRGERVMVALARKETAWLMMLRYSGDAGFSSRNPDHQNTSNEMMAFRLANGQVDEHPVAWTLPPSIWVAALVHFARTGERAEYIVWHEE